MQQDDILVPWAARTSRCPLSDVDRPDLRSFGCRARTVLDPVGAALILVLATVLFVLIGLAIKLESPGPVLRRHRAVGPWGREFELLRFRTTLEEGDVAPGSDRSAVSFPSACATPATWVGDLLRRWALDELPELINVLKGDMSLVGPRPRLLADTGQEAKAERCLPVKPGLTGLWHVRGSLADLDRPVDVEHYLRHRSLASDLGVLQRSVRAANRRQVR